MTLTFSLSGITEAQKIIRKKGKNLFSVPSSYCIIDIETTGLSPDFDSIIEVSAVKYIDGKDIFMTICAMLKSNGLKNRINGMSL